MNKGNKLQSVDGINSKRTHTLQLANKNSQKKTKKK